jgi:hypothetical protein
VRIVLISWLPFDIIVYGFTFKWCYDILLVICLREPELDESLRAFSFSKFCFSVFRMFFEDFFLPPLSIDRRAFNGEIVGLSTISWSEYL